MALREGRSMRKMKLISLVVPCFNEGAGVLVFHAAVSSVARSMPGFDFEFLFVDDGSRDDTLHHLVGLKEADQRVRVVELSRNFGKEAALSAGLDFASGDAVIPMDADMQDPPGLIPALADAWVAGAEVVLARRSDRRSDALLKRVTARFFYRLHNRVSDIKIPENVGDFRLMDRVVIDALRKLPERQRFMKGLFAWVGFRTVVVDYARPVRHQGQSKFSGLRLWNLAVEGITSFSAVPLKAWTYIGGIGALGALTYAAFIALRTLILGVDVPGYASLFVAVLFFGSVQLVGIGVLGEYIGRIYMEAKGRPVYLVRQLHEGQHGSDGV